MPVQNETFPNQLSDFIHIEITHLHAKSTNLSSFSDHGWVCFSVCTKY